MALATRDFSIRRILNRMIGAWVHWVSLNEVRLEHDEVYKRRNFFGRKITPVANWFFGICRAPLRFFKEVRGWQKWEVETFEMLHPQYHARAVGADAIVEDQLPGKPLWDYLKAGTLREEMLVAAAKEMRRAHGMWSDVHQGKWSHGDGAMGNVLYDEETGRARLIDFEVVHQKDIPAVKRQADDLHAFLMDLLSFGPRKTWLKLALAFLRTYGDEAVLAEFRRRLVVPKGMAWVWWKIRVNFAAEGMLAGRLATLGRAMDHELLSAAGAKRGSGRRNRKR